MYGNVTNAQNWIDTLENERVLLKEDLLRIDDEIKNVKQWIKEQWLRPLTSRVITLEQLKDIICFQDPMTLYKAYGLGENSFVQAYNGPFKLKKGNIDTELFYGEHKQTDFICISDCNIGAHHNNHWLFTDKNDAEEYVRRCKLKY